MISVYGEILIDMVSGKNNTFEYFVGGAPFNVSYAISKLEGNVKFIGCVGNDLLGKFIREFTNGKVESKIYIDNERNTTQAIIINDETGERNFCFLRKNCADYNIPLESLIEMEESNIVHVGSLMLNEEIGRKFADEVISKAKQNNILISFDVNYRDDIYCSQEEAIAIAKKYINQADIVKFSEDEILMITDSTELTEAVNKIKKDNQIVVITLGSKGSALYYNDKIIKADSIKVMPVDTTGAGDAFYGTLLSEIDKFGFETFVNDEELILKSLKKANVQGALATLKKGAVDGIVSKEELEIFMKSI